MGKRASMMMMDASGGRGRTRDYLGNPLRPVGGCEKMNEEVKGMPKKRQKKAKAASFKTFRKLLTYNN